MSPLILAVVLLLVPVRPDTATAYPTYTPYPTYTAVPSASPTPSPTASPTPLPPPKSGPGGTPGSPCAKGDFGIGIAMPIIGQETICIPVASFINSIFAGLLSLFTGAISAVIAPFNALLTATPDPTSWLDAQSIFNYFWGIGLALYTTLLVFTGLHYYRRMVFGGEYMGAPIIALSDALTGAIFVAALPWCLSTWLSLVNDLAASINNFVGTLNLDALVHLFGDGVAAMNGDPLLLIVDAILGLFMLLFCVLVALIRAVGVYVEIWLYFVAPLACACWVYPPWRPIAARWFASFASVTLWGSGFAVALKVIAVVALDLPGSSAGWANPVGKAVAAISGMVFLFGVPRLVDLLVGSAIAQASGAYTIAGGIVGGAVAGVTTNMGAIVEVARSRVGGKP